MAIASVVFILSMVPIGLAANLISSRFCRSNVSTDYVCPTSKRVAIFIASFLVILVLFVILISVFFTAFRFQR
jgi:hypothetical protein